VAHAHPPESLGLFDLHSDSYHTFAGAAARLGTMLDTTNEGLIYLGFLAQTANNLQ
jgi:hypothetical protein